jgi:hypothetical protein
MDCLPEELLTRVFEFLSYDRPHIDITNSRLVSKRLHALSSPFLINTAVIANRLDTLAKLRELLDHPYFSKHVTRLVWDASPYHEIPAESFEQYRLQCEHNPWQSSAMRRYRESVQDENAAKLALLQSTVGLSRLVGEHITPILNDDEKNDHDCPFEMAERGFLRRGHDDYHHRYHAQVELCKRRLTLRYLHPAFEKLPKLRHFEFSDFRALSRNGEYLSELCERLFGQTLGPDLLPDNLHCDGRAASWTSPGGCLLNLARINPQLKSLSFGHSEQSAWDALSFNARPVVAIPGMLLEEDEERWKSFLGSVRHLSLPVETSQDGIGLKYTVSSTRMLLSSSAPSLTHLRFETELYSGLWRDQWNLMPRVVPLFANIIGRIHFQCLTSLVLRGWLIPLRDLEDFLLVHATTLRNMHLINCCLEGASKDELMTCVRTKLEPALALEGVEIYGLVYEAWCEEDLTRAEVRADCCDIEEMFLGGRRNMAPELEQSHSDWRYRKKWWEDLEHSDDETYDDPMPVYIGGNDFDNELY